MQILHTDEMCLVAKNTLARQFPVFLFQTFVLELKDKLIENKVIQ